MAAKRKRDAEEMTRNALRELRDPSDFTITVEERLKMRHIPFFVLPSYETLPKTRDVQAKVDTRNSSYHPSQPKSATTTSRSSSAIADYSHVKSRVDTGKRRSVEVEITGSQNGEHHNGGASMARSCHSSVRHLNHKSRSLPRTSASTPSLYQVKPSTRTYRSVSTSQLPSKLVSHSRSSVNYRTVKSRVGSLDNIHHTPGGQQKTILKRSSSEATPPIRQSAKVTFGWKDSSYTPGGGKTKVVTYPTGHFSAQAKSRVDQTDPNPAHKLKRSLKDLTLSQGRKVNPRFAEKRVKTDSHLIRRFSSSDIDSGSRKQEASAKHKLCKSITLGLFSHEQFKEDSTDFTVEKSPDILDPLPSDNEMENQVSKYGTFSIRASNYDNDPTQDNLTEEQTDSIDVVGPKSMDTQNPSDTGPLFTAVNGQCSNEQDIAVYDIEVTNSVSETTVVLKNLFSKSSLSKEDETGADNRRRIESSNSSYSYSQLYEESEDSDSEAEEEALLAACMNTFPHGIPKLIVSNELGDIVEVIVDPPTSNNANEATQGILSDTNTDDLEFNMSDLVNVLSSLQREPHDKSVSLDEDDDECSDAVEAGFPNGSEVEDSSGSTRL